MSHNMTPVTPTTLLGLLSHIPDDQTAIIQPEQNIRITWATLHSIRSAPLPAGHWKNWCVTPKPVDSSAI